MSTLKKGRKTPAGRARRAQEPRTGPKAGESKGTTTTPAVGLPAAPTASDLQANPRPEPESLASRAARAADCKEKAAHLRASATDDLDKDSGSRAAENAAWARKVADRNERDAEELNTVVGALVCGIGGEVTPADPHGNAERYFLNTLSNPNITSAAASRVRMEQAAAICPGGTGTDSLVQALDAAETLGASNSLEKMGAHQFAAAHTLAMKLMHEGAELCRKRDFGHTKNGSTLDALALYNVEGCRLLNMATRLMAASQGWLSTLARVRQAGRQVVVHQYQNVQVNDGGQAVVTTTTTPGGGGRKRGEGGERGE